MPQPVVSTTAKWVPFWVTSEQPCWCSVCERACGSALSAQDAEQAVLPLFLTVPGHLLLRRCRRALLRVVWALKQVMAILSKNRFCCREMYTFPFTLVYQVTYNPGTDVLFLPETPAECLASPVELQQTPTQLNGVFHQEQNQTLAQPCIPCTPSSLSLPTSAGKQLLREVLRCLLVTMSTQGKAWSHHPTCLGTTELLP